MIKSFILQCKRCNKTKEFNFQVFPKFSEKTIDMDCDCFKDTVWPHYPFQKLFWEADKLRRLWRMFPQFGIMPTEKGIIDRGIDRTPYIRSFKFRLKSKRITHEIFFRPYHHMDTDMPTKIADSRMTLLDDPVDFQGYSFPDCNNGLAPTELYLFVSLAKMWNCEVHYLLLVSRLEMLEMDVYGIPRKNWKG